MRVARPTRGERRGLDGALRESADVRKCVHVLRFVDVAIAPCFLLLRAGPLGALAILQAMAVYCRETVNFTRVAPAACAVISVRLPRSPR